MARHFGGGEASGGLAYRILCHLTNSFSVEPGEAADIKDPALFTALRHEA